jgi:hypothetical protein
MMLFEFANGSRIVHPNIVVENKYLAGYSEFGESNGDLKAIQK